MSGCKRFWVRPQRDIRIYYSTIALNGAGAVVVTSEPFAPTFDTATDSCRRSLPHEDCQGGTVLANGARWRGATVGPLF